MTSVIEDINAKFMKKAVVSVRSGDTVRVHQRIKEGNKERVQVFQGLVIKTSKSGGHLSRITVRRISSGIGVEKSFLLHSPLVVKVEVTKRSKVRRNYLSYMRSRTGKSARLTNVNFDKNINEIPEEEVAKEEQSDKSDVEVTEEKSTDDKTVEEKATEEVKEPESKPDKASDKAEVKKEEPKRLAD